MHLETATGGGHPHRCPVSTTPTPTAAASQRERERERARAERELFFCPPCVTPVQLYHSITHRTYIGITSTRLLLSTRHVTEGHANIPGKMRVHRRFTPNPCKTWTGGTVDAASRIAEIKLLYVQSQYNVQRWFTRRQ